MEKGKPVDFPQEKGHFRNTVGKDIEKLVVNSYQSACCENTFLENAESQRGGNVVESNATWAERIYYE